MGTLDEAKPTKKIATSVLALAKKDVTFYSAIS